MLALEITQMNKSFGKLKAVTDLSFSIRAGEAVAFIGPNGAGKSTTMRAIAGLSHIDSGQIKIAGQDVLEHPVEARKHLGYVPQDIELYRYLTGEEFLTFMAKMRGIDDAKIPNSVEELLQLCDLSDARRRLIREYSGGMARKIAMAAALIAKPELIVLDESFVGLDPESSYKISQYLKHYTEAGGALLLSSHILDMLEGLCKRFLILNKGKCVGDYSKEELENLKKDPKTPSLTALYLHQTGQAHLIEEVLR